MIRFAWSTAWFRIGHGSCFALDVCKPSRVGGDLSAPARRFCFDFVRYAGFDGDSGIIPATRPSGVTGRFPGSSLDPYQEALPMRRVCLVFLIFVLIASGAMAASSYTVTKVPRPGEAVPTSLTDASGALLSGLQESGSAAREALADNAAQVASGANEAVQGGQRVMTEAQRKAYETSQQIVQNARTAAENAETAAREAAQAADDSARRATAAAGDSAENVLARAQAEADRIIADARSQARDITMNAYNETESLVNGMYDAQHARVDDTGLMPGGNASYYLDPSDRVQYAHQTVEYTTRELPWIVVEDVKIPTTNTDNLNRYDSSDPNQNGENALKALEAAYNEAKKAYDNTQNVAQRYVAEDAKTQSSVNGGIRTQDGQVLSAEEYGADEALRKIEEERRALEKARAEFQEAREAAAQNASGASSAAGNAVGNLQDAPVTLPKYASINPMTGRLSFSVDEFPGDAEFLAQQGEDGIGTISVGAGTDGDTVGGGITIGDPHERVLPNQGAAGTSATAIAPNAANPEAVSGLPGASTGTDAAGLALGEGENPGALSASAKEGIPAGAQSASGRISSGSNGAFRVGVNVGYAIHNGKYENGDGNEVEMNSDFISFAVTMGYRLKAPVEIFGNFRMGFPETMELDGVTHDSDTQWSGKKSSTMTDFERSRSFYAFNIGAAYIFDLDDFSILAGAGFHFDTLNWSEEHKSTEISKIRKMEYTFQNYGVDLHFEGRYMFSDSAFISVMVEPSVTFSSRYKREYREGGAKVDTVEDFEKDAGKTNIDWYFGVGATFRF